MLTKKLALAAATGTVLLAAAPAFANPPHWAPAHGWRAQHGTHHQYRPQRVIVVRPAPVYYVPAPVYTYPPAPVYYAPARPVVVYRQPGLSVSFGL